MLFLAIFYSPCKWFNRFSSPTSLLEMMKSCGFSVYYFFSSYGLKLPCCTQVQASVTCLV
ncbi:hypothetical protein AZJ33_03965 [Streptococcus pneumoniae]|uniref:Uncharacterized protein n=1 Tax=Streptococcus pneumoniae TaxID=1313 RepID=A0A558QFT8_STREE|nr:hypothetical protein AZK39_09585 [Streptococcus pneumoniae]TVV61746.1 hypothetical protein AZK32_01665 [Streptococcus pneumoniae]TVV62337.1 hypothetical protein AZK34_07265 [Streptococcus pneumoniae]TVV64107.1 hypothetical protein AZK33_03895 [Streptococcus pneumoniae]TVV65995.1 hypothetical protein AZK31_07100 [Streptococcus pneumoniae]